MKPIVDLKTHLKEIEVGYLKDALDKAQGCHAQAARLLGLNRTTFVEKLRRNGFELNQAVQKIQAVKRDTR
jgi:DNA-binding NtrC family response regulator